MAENAPTDSGIPPVAAGNPPVHAGTQAGNPSVQAEQPPAQTGHPSVQAAHPPVQAEHPPIMDDSGSSIRRGTYAGDPVVAPGVLEAEPQLQGDGDSAVGSSYEGSETTSLSSSVYKFRMEHGRRYHGFKAGAYFMPNDTIENERLDLQHNLCIYMQDSQLFICPAFQNKKPNRVLDAGCGTGVWAIDFADEYPEAEVVGIDLSPIQPPFIPPNVKFFVDDLEEEWSYYTPFDMIYMRLLTGSIKDWPKLFRQAFRNLTPGGYIETCDPSNPVVCDDGTLPPDCALVKWNRLLIEASVKLDAPIDSTKTYPQHLADAGFVNIVVTELKWPLNQWPKDPKYKELGAWSLENMLSALQALSLKLFTLGLGWTPDELEVFLVDVRKDMKDRRIHAYWPVHVIHAQRPE